MIDENDVLKFLESDFCYMTLLDLSIKQEMYKLNSIYSLQLALHGI